MAEEKDFIRRIKAELVSKGLIKGDEFLPWIQESERQHCSIVETIYHSKRIPEKKLVTVLCSVFGYPPISTSTFIIDPTTLSLIPKKVAEKYRILPISCYEKTLTVAISDPTNIAALDDLRALAGLRIKPTLASPTELDAAIRKYYSASPDSSLPVSAESYDRIVEEARSQSVGGQGMRGLGDLSDLLEEANATPVVKLVNRLLIEAFRRQASDVFIEPWEKTMRVRYRVDGVLEEILNAPNNMVGAVVSRIKVMSRLNIAERRIPQDGRFKARAFGREVDLRVSILPTSHGEKACLRVLDTTAQAQDLDKLGFSPKDLEVMRRSAEKPHGMILVTGPTGSGKTTTLYSILQYLNGPDKNITTVEEPVEYQVQGINQVNVREQVGLNFPAALRSILRQDPDIILIGEIRDLTTMDIAIKAALTGHLVLSTLHTNDSTSALVRMVNMGIEPFLISSSVLMISAQRLVRRLCLTCREPYTPGPELLESLGLAPRGGPTFYRAKGCNQCRSMGLKGRTVITELFEMTQPIQDLIMRGASNEEIRRGARENGMKTLRESGIEKVLQGETSAEEVTRVTSPEPVLRTGKS